MRPRPPAPASAFRQLSGCAIIDSTMLYRLRSRCVHAGLIAPALLALTLRLLVPMGLVPMGFGAGSPTAALCSLAARTAETPSTPADTGTPAQADHCELCFVPSLAAPPDPPRAAAPLWLEHRAGSFPPALACIAAAYRPQQARAPPSLS